MKINDQTPDVGHYTPKYDLIEKKIPIIKIIKENRLKHLNIKKMETKVIQPKRYISPDKRLKPLEPVSTIMNKHKSSISSYDIKQHSNDQIIYNDNSNNNSITNKNQNNHTGLNKHETSSLIILSNNSNLQKKSLKKKSKMLLIDNLNSNNSYINFKKNKVSNQIPLFNKMKGRETQIPFKNIIPPGTPTVGFYNPKYSFVKCNTSCCLFGEKIDPFLNKKLLMNKAIHSYNYSGDITVLRFKHAGKLARDKLHLLIKQEVFQ